MLVIVGVVVGVIALCIIFFPKVTYVDARPAASFGERYFSALKHTEIDDAFAMYTDGFLQRAGQDWRRTITELDTRNGSVMDFKTKGAHVAPVILRDKTTLPCVLAAYQVTRKTLISEERLTICPHQRGADYGIAGHEIIPPSGEHLIAGLTITEKTIYKYPNTHK